MGYCAVAFDTHCWSKLSVCVVVLSWLGEVISSWSSFFATWIYVVRAVKTAISKARASDMEEFISFIAFGFTRFFPMASSHLWHILLLLCDLDG